LTRESTSEAVPRRNLTRKLIERGFSDADMEKILRRKLDADFRPLL
jgi:microsomal dipeptidase-like Zn-dependent dipeptidase